MAQRHFSRGDERYRASVLRPELTIRFGLQILRMSPFSRFAAYRSVPVGPMSLDTVDESFHLGF